MTLCDRTTGKEVRVLSTKCAASSLAFSADGKCLGALDSTAKRVTIWSLEDGRETNWTPPASKNSLLAPLTLSPDGSLFATSANGSVRVVETATGEELWQVGAHLSGLPAQEFVFSPNGRLLAAAGTDGVVRVWELASGEERYHFAGHRAGVFSVAFSPDSQRLASASYDSTALVWDVGTLPPVPVVRATAEEQWSALSGRDARAAAKAIVALTDSPDTAVPLLRKKLLLPSATAGQIRGWLADLGDAEFQVRETASRELAKRGDLVLPNLRRALADANSAEVRGRLERLLARLGAQSPDRRAVIRGVEALERMGTIPAAKQLLRELAEAPAESLLGREAKAAYQRLKPSPQ